MDIDNSSRADRSLRVLVWPPFSNRTDSPYSRLLYRKMIDRGVAVDEFSPMKGITQPYDIWHVHGPDDLLRNPRTTPTAARLAGLRGLMTWIRRQGTRVIWTIRDPGPHESQHPYLEHWFWRWFLPQVDGFITLSESARERAEEEFAILRDVPGFVVPHGHYRNSYSNNIGRAEARTSLGLSPGQRMVLYLGRIEPHKNVAKVVEAFRELESSDTVLYIVGSPATQELRDEMEHAAGDDPRIRLVLRFIPDEKVQVYLNAADLVVLPSHDTLHSGSALLALSFNRPALVPARGAMEELRAQVGAEWVTTFEGEMTPRVLEEGLTWVRESRRLSEAPLENLAWDAIADQMIQAYRTVLEETADNHSES